MLSSRCCKCDADIGGWIGGCNGAMERVEAVTARTLEDNFESLPILDLIAIGIEENITKIISDEAVDG